MPQNLDNLQLNKEDLNGLHPMEVDLILNLRHEYRFGEVSVLVHEGIPQQILKTVKRKKLGTFEVIHTPGLDKLYPELYNKVS